MTNGITIQISHTIATACMRCRRQPPVAFLVEGGDGKAIGMLCLQCAVGDDKLPPEPDRIRHTIDSITAHATASGADGVIIIRDADYAELRAAWAAPHMAERDYEITAPCPTIMVVVWPTPDNGPPGIETR